VGRRDYYAFGTASLAGAIIGALSGLGHWGDAATTLAVLAAMLVVGTLFWHFDWSRFGRLRRRH